MDTEKRKISILLILNLGLGLTLFVGINQTIGIIDFVSGITLHSLAELKESFAGYLIRFLSQDIKIIIGVLACLGIIIYDAILFFQWFNSFKITGEKTCSSCQKKLIREQRTTADRIISYAIPIHRYRCVGCGQEYLKRTRKQHLEQEVLTGPVEVKKIHM